MSTIHLMRLLDALERIQAFGQEYPDHSVETQGDLFTGADIAEDAYSLRLLLKREDELRRERERAEDHRRAHGEAA